MVPAHKKSRKSSGMVVRVMNFAELQETIGIRFRDESVLRQAFTHSSYVNEQRGKRIQDNERLEFLGDAVLELTVSQFLYKTFPKMSEGEMTKLRAAIVCEPSLVKFAELLRFGELVLLGKGEELTGGKQRPLCWQMCLKHLSERFTWTKVWMRFSPLWKNTFIRAWIKGSLPT